jgi:S-methylmethionine-dependent homocysteine/selenocysteine methylase
MLTFSFQSHLFSAHPEKNSAHEVHSLYAVSSCINLNTQKIILNEECDHSKWIQLIYYPMTHLHIPQEQNTWLHCFEHLKTRTEIKHLEKSQHVIYSPLHLTHQSVDVKINMM